MSLFLMAWFIVAFFCYMVTMTTLDNILVVTFQFHFKVCKRDIIVPISIFNSLSLVVMATTHSISVVTFYCLLKLASLMHYIYPSLMSGQSVNDSILS